MQNSHHSKVQWFFLTFSWYQSHTWISIPRSSIASNSSSNPFSTLLPFNTMIHMVIIKLSSSNYLLWKSQLLPFLKSQGLLVHMDGTLVPPPFRRQPTNTWRGKQLTSASLAFSSPPLQRK